MKAKEEDSGSQDGSSNKMDVTENEPTANLGMFDCFFDADLLAYKGFCFFLYGAYGGFIPYLPLYFKQLGIQANYTGTLVGIRPLIQCIGAPFFGVLANRFRAGKLLLLGGIFAWILKALMILAVIPHDQHCIKMLENKTANTTLVYAYNLWDFSEHEEQWVVLPALNRPVLIRENKITIVDQAAEEQPEEMTSIPKEIENPLKEDRSPEDGQPATAPPTQPINNTVVGNESAVQKREHGSPKSWWHSFRKRKLLEVDAPERAILTFSDLGKKITQSVNVLDPKINQTINYLTQIDTIEVHNMFIIFLLVIIIGEFLESPAYGLSDAALLKRLGDHRDYYGRIRMWGSLGWFVASLLVGGIIYSSRFYLCSVLQNNYLVTFYIYIAMVAAAFVNALWYKFDYSDSDNADREVPAESKLGKVAEAFLTARHCSFMVGVLYIGLCYGLLIHFVNWYVDDLGGSTLIMGFSGAAREAGGIAFFFLSGSVIRTLGNLNTMLLSVLSYVVCFLCYAVLDNPWVTPALELLDGATYALAWSNSVSYMGMLGDPIGMVETTQGILQGVFWGLGNGGGTMISGLLYHHYGGVTTFRIFAVIGAAVIAFLCVSNYIINKTEDKSKSKGGYQALAKDPNDTQ